MEQTIDRIMRKKEVLTMLGISDPTLWRWERAGHFPKRVKLGANSVGWWLSEIENWKQSRPRG